MCCVGKGDHGVVWIGQPKIKRTFSLLFFSKHVHWKVMCVYESVSAALSCTTTCNNRKLLLGKREGIIDFWMGWSCHITLQTMGYVLLPVHNQQCKIIFQVPMEYLSALSIMVFGFTLISFSIQHSFYTLLKRLFLQTYCKEKAL